MARNACFGCEERTAECHSKCEKYLSMVRKHDDEKLELRERTYDANMNSSCTITKHLCDLSVSASGWVTELNMISWDGGKPVYDIRTWSKGHKQCGKGKTFTETELRSLEKVLNKMFSEVSING